MFVELTKEYVQEVFSYLEKPGQTSKFFDYVVDNVSWKVKGTHPLAGCYLSKEHFIQSTFGRLAKVLKEGVILKVDNILISGSFAVVEMHALSTSNWGEAFNNEYCWIVGFKDGQISEVRAYLDSALVAYIINKGETENSKKVT